MKTNRFIRIRLYFGLTRKDFCNKFNLSINTWTKLETNENIKIQIKTIKRINQNCKVNIDYLLGNSEEMFEEKWKFLKNTN